ncbi:PREDICTED: uncharacterized protein LOC109591386 [Amphimedon queenslandica]|nr:PREDICTED: uncharacterized protein LOC109591386 [Amphimedon queenslandica]|eukprot:XP_019862681.1 PREDICTED: uncharacterized protein LOC109591386 [Amphimedon queenslandica]
MAQIHSLSVDGLVDLLQKEIPGLEAAVSDNIRRHKIDGQIFIQLNEEYLREIAPLLGDRVRLKQIISSSLEPSTCNFASSPVSFSSPSYVSDSLDSTAQDVSRSTHDVSHVTENSSEIPFNNWAEKMTIPKHFSKVRLFNHSMHMHNG